VNILQLRKTAALQISGAARWSRGMTDYFDESSTYWMDVPSVEQETQLIQSKANEWRKIWSADINPSRPGFERRSQRNRTAVFQKLAILQERYYATDLKDEVRRIGTHSMLLLIPMLGFGQKQLCQHSGLPCNKLKNIHRFRLGSDRDIVRCELRHGRHELVWQMLTHFVQKQQPYAHLLGYHMPVVSVRWRESHELWEGSNSAAANHTRDLRENAIGRAVMIAYKSYAERPGNSIASAIQAIVDLREIEHEKCGQFDNVNRLYKEFRKAAFIRGYADLRALSAACNGEAWPQDQVWLSDFPRISNR
jgi:hypothetical protein